MPGITTSDSSRTIVEGLGDPQGVLGIARGDDLVAEALEAALHGAADARLVLDDQQGPAATER
jgi:hypothetical protein